MVQILCGVNIVFEHMHDRQINYPLIEYQVSPITISKANLQLNDIECGNKKSAAENNDLLHQVLVSVDLVSINHDVSRSSFMYSCSQLGEIDQNVSLMQKLR